MHIFHIIYIAIDQSPRRFIKCFEKGTPNFLCVPSCKLSDNNFKISYVPVLLSVVTLVGAIFKTVISIYAQDKLSPLPSLEEVLICNQRTTVEEVIIFILCLS